jgi:hypothetical protein
MSEFNLKRISYIQVQIGSMTDSIIFNFSVRPYKIVEDVPVDGPIYLEKSYTRTMNPSEIGEPCINFSEYLMSIVEEE